MMTKELTGCPSVDRSTRSSVGLRSRKRKRQARRQRLPVHARRSACHPSEQGSKSLSRQSLKQPPQLRRLSPHRKRSLSSRRLRHLRKLKLKNLQRPYATLVAADRSDVVQRRVLKRRHRRLRQSRSRSQSLNPSRKSGHGS